jgi:hypothetical protein
MQLVETEMLLAAAAEQLQAWGHVEGEVHARYMAIREKHTKPELQLSHEDMKALQALASPRLLTVWFNSWYVKDGHAMHAAKTVSAHESRGCPEADQRTPKESDTTVHCVELVRWPQHKLACCAVNHLPTTNDVV